VRTVTACFTQVVASWQRDILNAGGSLDVHVALLNTALSSSVVTVAYLEPERIGKIHVLAYDLTTRSSADFAQCQ
jgi:hypothetical protein